VQAIPPNRINDVVYFNPSDMEFPIAFNILEAVDEDKKNLVASGMMGVFKKIWPDVWSPRMEYILNNTILALLDYPGSTMLGVNRMMSDKDFRKRVYPKVKDPVVKSFWINEFDQWEDRFRKEAVAAIQNKVGQFLSSPVIRHIVGQPKSTIDMREIMDNKKILIVNLSKGRIGEDAMRLLGGMVVTKIQLAAMGRVDMPETKREDFFLYVDEFQNFATEAFANILSEARKYRLSLILAHQYISQLIFDGNTTVRDAVFGNVGTLVSFRVGAEDAEQLEKEFDPIFLMNDIVNLSKYNIYLKLMIDGIAGDAFSAATLPPADLSDTKDNTEKAIAVSRERYGRSRKEIEEKIARWSGMFDYGEFEKKPPARSQVSQTDRADRVTQERSLPEKANLASLKVPARPVLQNKPIRRPSVAEPAKNNPMSDAKEVKSDASNTEKQMFDAVCSSCEEKIQVPFKPDPTRPTFCRECLKDYQRSRARSQKEKEEISSARSYRPAAAERISSMKKEDSQPVTYASSEKPMSLGQMAHIAPKKFTSQRKKPQIDLGGVRDLIDKTKNK